MPRIPFTDHPQLAILDILQPGDTAIDATVGNGHDTLFLAEAVNGTGKVYGFDIQQAALDNTRRQLEQNNLADRVSLFHTGHERMAELVPKTEHGQVKAIMFNLGYLPGSDKIHTTRTDTTLMALDTAIQLLSPGGRLSVLAYTGHEGGQQEADAVRHWAVQLPAEDFSVSLEIPPTKRGNPPVLIIVEKQ